MQDAESVRQDLYRRLMELPKKQWDSEVGKADEVEKWNREQSLLAQIRQNHINDQVLVNERSIMNPESKKQEPISTAGAALDSAYAKLKEEKPEERGEKARCYAVCITELEKVMAYYAVFCQ